MFRVATLIIFLSISLNLSAQPDCDFDFIAPLDQCQAFDITDVYSGDLNAPLGVGFYTDRSQGIYDFQINGVIFENQHIFSFFSFCCEEVYASDFSYDFENPGNYVFNVESVSHDNNECVAVNGTPLSTHSVTVHPQPTFDLRYECQPNGDLKYDVILTSQLLPFTSLSHLTFSGVGSTNLIPSGQPGDTIYSEIATLTLGKTYTPRIIDCTFGTDFIASTYTHNCSSCTDTTPPSARCQDIEINLGIRPVDIDFTDIDNGSSDDCQIVSFTLSESTFDCSDIGQNIVTLQVADGAGNISECTSIVTVNDPSNTCAGCYALDRAPEIEFSHTELDGNTIKIWYRFVDFSIYSHLNPRLSYINSNNYAIDDIYGDPARFLFEFGDNSRFDYLDEFMFLKIQRDFQFQDCDRIETNLLFVDDFCDVSYLSNSIILNCDNDGDGFAIDVDCNDNNATQFPGAIEICDGVDNDCDGQIDEGFNDIFGNCCPFELNVHGSGIVNGTYKADHTINSEGQVQNNDVEFRAGSQVKLDAGFEVSPGSIFHGRIAPCN